jgi:High-temperature-induced dauer-formation protein
LAIVIIIYCHSLKKESTEVVWCYKPRQTICKYAVTQIFISDPGLRKTLLYVRWVAGANCPHGEDICPNASNGGLLRSESTCVFDSAAMGASESKLVFKQGVFRLSEDQAIPAGDPYWSGVRSKTTSTTLMVTSLTVA